MTHAAKRLGLALGALFALSALAASPALAAEAFHSEKEKTIITAAQDVAAPVQKLELESAFKVECSKFKGQGTETGIKTAENLYTTLSVTVLPEYSGSPARGGAKCDSTLGPETVEVHSHECHFRLGAETVKEGHAYASVICPKNQQIVIEGGGLTVRITGGPENLFGGQEVNQNLTGVHYVNTGSAALREITVEATVSGIHYTCEPEFTCFLAGLPKTGTAKFTGKSTAAGFEDCGVSGAETRGYTECAQVGVWKE